MAEAEDSRKDVGKDFRMAMIPGDAPCDERARRKNSKSLQASEVERTMAAPEEKGISS